MKLADRPEFAWWRSALAGHAPAITGEPECGFFKRRTFKNGPWVAVAIWYGDPPRDGEGTILSDAPLLCAVDGKPADALEVWTWVAAKPITEAEYNARVNEARQRTERGESLLAPSPDRPNDAPTFNLLNAPIPKF